MTKARRRRKKFHILFFDFQNCEPPSGGYFDFQDWGGVAKFTGCDLPPSGGCGNIPAHLRKNELQGSMTRKLKKTIQSRAPLRRREIEGNTMAGRQFGCPGGVTCKSQS